MATPFDDSQGITFTFGSYQFTATQISVTKARAEFDVSTTDQITGDCRRMRVGKLNDVSIKVDWIGGNVPVVKQTAVFTITGTDLGASSFSGKPAICTGMSISGSAGDLLKGSATFKVSQD